MDIKTVLCPLGFTTAPQRELRLAIQLCRAFQAKLILHHNLDTLLPSSLATNWMYAETHAREDTREESRAVRNIQKLLASIPASVPSEAKITHGPQEFAVLSLARSVEAGLIVVGIPVADPSERRIVLERILVQSPCAVLVIREPQEEGSEIDFIADTAKPEPMVVPVDFAPESLRSLEYAFELARSLPITLHLLYLEKTLTWRELRLPAFRLQEQRENRIGQWRDRLSEMIPADLKERVKVHMRAGNLVEGVVRSVEENQSKLVLMGTHSKGIMGRLLSGPSFSHVLWRSSCSLWLVPTSKHEDAVWAEEQAGYSGN